MRKKISIIAIMATIAIATAWNMNVTKERVALNDILLSNVEALAGCETFGGSCFWTTSYGSCCSGGGMGCSPCDD